MADTTLPATAASFKDRPKEGLALLRHVASWSDVECDFEDFDGFDGRALAREALDALSALTTQFSHDGCTCTFPSDDCCAYAKAKAFQNWREGL